MYKIIHNIKTYKYIEYIILTIIILIGFFVRLYKINNPLADWHSWRQADTSSVSRRYVNEGINLLYPKYQDISSIQTSIFNPNGYRFVEFPFFNLAQALTSKIFNGITLEVWGRLISIFCALLSSFVLFLIGKRFMGKAGGIISAAFYLFIPFNIYFTRVILPEPMTVMFALFFVYFYIIFIETSNFKYLYISAILFSISLLLKPYIIFYCIPLIYLTLKKYPAREILKNFKLLVRFLIFLDITLIPLLLWRAWMNQYPEGIPFWTWAFNGDGIRFRPAFWRWIFGERVGNLILGIWGLVPFSFGLMSAKKIVFNHLFLFGMFLYVSVVATASVRHDYYQIFTIPAISLVLAQGSLFMWEAKNFNKTISRTLLIFSLILMLGIGAYQIKEFYKINHPEIIEAGNALDKIAPTNALVIAPYNGDTAFLYQTKRQGWPFVDRPINELITLGARYFVSVNLNDAQTIEFTNKFTTLEKTSTYIILDLGKYKK